ncbi:TetR/AcrR family transcriptional regulator [soil metagenome]
MSQAHRQYGGVPATQRRDQRRRLLLEACLDLVGTRGISAVTAESVAAQAKLTKRYFYESFADRDAILVTALDELFADMLETMRGAMTCPVEEIVELFVSTLCTDTRRARLYAESVGLPALQARRESAIATFSNFIANDGDNADTPDESVKRQLMTRMIVVGLTDVVTSWIGGVLPAVDRTTLVSAIVTLANAVGRGQTWQSTTR